MKLRTKLLLLMGLTAFLVVAGILLAALTYLTSTLQWIHEEATKYATTDMQIRARNNLFRFRDSHTLTALWETSVTGLEIFRPTV